MYPSRPHRILPLAGPAGLSLLLVACASPRGRGKAKPEAVRCSVFDDGNARALAPTHELHFEGGLVRPADGSNGDFRKWFGDCRTESGTVARFGVFGEPSTAGRHDAVYIRLPDQACGPDDSATGDCGPEFGLGETAVGEVVECFIFDGNGEQSVGPSYSWFVEDGHVCAKTGEHAYACRDYWGHCRTIPAGPVILLEG